MSYVLSFNPVWLFDDLEGNILDDTYYMFALSHTNPTTFENVYSTPSGTPWAQPIEFLANGTLPVDIFWDPTQIYRIEIHQGNTLSSPLIYVADPYIPVTGGSEPPSTLTLSGDNQLTNPQFSVLNFTSPYTTTSNLIDVGQGWFLSCQGSSGTVTLTQEIYPGDDNFIFSPPYALQIAASGWTSLILYQKFLGNGALWTSSNVAMTFTASATTPINIATQLYYSDTSTSSAIINQTMTTTLAGYFGAIPTGTSTNSGSAPTAYTECQILIPTPCTVVITNIQLVGQSTPIEVPYNEETPQRQQDYTFHYYQPSILLQPKNSFLTAWNFGLNPWQYTSTTLGNLANNAYTADQTIVIQQAYVTSATANNVAISQAAFSNNYGFQVTAVTANNAFGVLQYIDADTMSELWGYSVSSLVNLTWNTTHSTPMQVKMRLIYNSTTPVTVAQHEPVLSWSVGSDPLFNASNGWDAAGLSALNDPVYTLVPGQNFLKFNQFQLPVNGSGSQVLGIMLYTLNNMNQSATADSFIINDISLSRNDWAIATQPQTFDQVMQNCQYYYEQSYDSYPSSFIASAGQIQYPMSAVISPAAHPIVSINSLTINYNTIKRSSSPTVTLYSPVSGTSSNIRVVAYADTSGQIYNSDVAISSWGTPISGTKNYTLPITSTPVLLASAASNSVCAAYGALHFISDARLGR